MTVPRIPVEVRPSVGRTYMHPDDVYPEAFHDLRRQVMLLAGIPETSERSLQVEPVTKELARLLNAAYQGCTWCGAARNARALEHGLSDEMVAQLRALRREDFPEPRRSLLLLARAFLEDPASYSPDDWSEALEHAREDELIDVALFMMWVENNKGIVVLGLDPGPVQRIYTADDPAYAAAQ